MEVDSKKFKSLTIKGVKYVFSGDCEGGDSTSLHNEDISIKLNNENNIVEGKYSIVGGDSTNIDGQTSRVGGNGYKIISVEEIDSNTHKANITIEGTCEYAVDDILNFDGKSHEYDSLKITNISDDKKVITVEWINHDKSTKLAISGEDGLYEDWVWVENKPLTGTDNEFNNASFAFGENAVAMGRSAISMGRDTKAIGNYSHAEGRNTKATYSSHAEGQDTTALGKYSHTEGRNTKTIGQYAHAEGNNTIALIDAQHASGQYNTNYHIDIEMINLDDDDLKAKWYTFKSFGIDELEGKFIPIYSESSYREISGDELESLDSNRYFIQENVNENVFPKQSEVYRKYKDNFYRLTLEPINPIMTIGNGTKQHTIEGKNLNVSGGHSNALAIDLDGNAWFDGEVYVNGSTSEDFKLMTNAEVTQKANEAVNQAKAYSDTNLIKANKYTDNSYVIAGKKAGTTLGGRATAEGYNTTASNFYSHAEGEETIASGKGSHAEGGPNVDKEGPITYTTASGSYSHAEGEGTIASGSHGSHAEGRLTKADGYNSHAEGWGTEAKGKHSHAECYDTVAEGEGAHAEGGFSQANGKHSHAEGNRTIANGSASHAEGGRTDLVQDGPSTNVHTIATGIASHAEGLGTNSIGNGSHTEGLCTIALNNYSHAGGKYNAPYQFNEEYWPSIPEGQVWTFKNFSIDWETGLFKITYNKNDVKRYDRWQDIDDSEEIMGFTFSEIKSGGINTTNEFFILDYGDRYKYTLINNNSAVEIGAGENLTNSYSVNQNLSNIKERKNIYSLDWNGNANFAGGVTLNGDIYTPKTITANSIQKIIAFGDPYWGGVDETAEVATEDFVRELIYNNRVGKGEKSPHSENVQGEIFNHYGPDDDNVPGNTAKIGGHAEGYRTDANIDAHSEGYFTKATGQGSHSEGMGSCRLLNIFDDDYYVEARGKGSHAEGWCTIAAGDYQHVQGQLNIEDTEKNTSQWSKQGKYAHIVGNGYPSWGPEDDPWADPEPVRSNAHTLEWNGTAWFAGDVYVKSTSGKNRDAGSKKLATEDFVVSQIDVVEAQMTYMAMETNTVLMSARIDYYQKIFNWCQQGLWSFDMVLKAANKNIITQEQADLIISN